ncbi:TPA: ERCC4 helicase, partial [Escherichia coli]|nr:ERCC4 helicase [Escherichia coli]
MNDAINYICNRIKNSDGFSYCYEKLLISISKNLFNPTSSNPITQREYQQLLKFSDFLSNSEKEEDRNLALKIISAIYDLYKEDHSCQLLTKSILSKLGLFAAEEVFTDSDIKLPLSYEISS